MLSGFIKRLIFARQFSMIEGSIKVLGVRQLMFSANLFAEMQKIDRKKTYDVTKRIMKQEIAEYAQKLGTEQEGLLKNIENIYETMGLGDLEIVLLDGKTKTSVIRIKNCPIAQSAGSRGRSCIAIAGVLAGMFSFVFEKNVECVEKNCVADGSDYCQFEVR